MKYYLYYQNDVIKEINKDDVLSELYYKLAVIPTFEQFKKHNISVKKNYINQAKSQIANLRNLVPLFDINTKNIFLINPENLYSRVLQYDYRCPDENTVFILKNTIKALEKKKKTELNNLIYEKLNKNINFLNCFDLPTLRKTYYKLFYYNNVQTKNMTSCIRPSYFSFLKNGKPYYTFDELKILALNSNLILEPSNIIKICDYVTSNDISYKILLNNHIYIKENYARNYIQLYTLLGSYYLNSYLRNNNNYQDKFLEKQIFNIWSIINKAPAFDKQYYVYRFIDNDDYLNKLKIGDIYEENSFISTTRNPFYNPKTNVFGFILLKIKVPINIEGIGLCIETNSLFPNEEEILFNPGKLKLVGLDNDFIYHHPNERAQKSIKRKYEFEYVESLKVSPTTLIKYKRKEIEIPTIDFNSIIILGSNFEEKLLHLFEKIPFINDHRYFYSYIGKTKYKFQVFYLNVCNVYDKYFFLQKHKDVKDELYFLIQNEDSGTIKLLVEIRDIISVNYIFKYIGSTKCFDDSDLITFISLVGKVFKINEIIVHDNYISYESIAEKKLLSYNATIYDFDNPDTNIINLYTGYSKYYHEELIKYIISINSLYPKVPYICKYDFEGVTPAIKYNIIDSLAKVKTESVLKIKEITHIYTIFKKNQIDCEYVLNFYLFLHYNYFYLLNELNECIYLFIINIDEYSTTSIKSINPWSNNYFIINPEVYLFKKGIVTNISQEKKDMINVYIDRINRENEVRKSKFRNLEY